MDSLLNSSKAMTTHVTEQYKLLEKLFGDQKFKVKFDEKNKADMVWVEKQVEHILDSLPEVKLVEAKANGARAGDKELDNVNNTLTAALDIIKNNLDLKKKEVVKAKALADTRKAEELKLEAQALAVRGE
jgi:hypothetical protein